MLLWFYALTRWGATYALGHVSPFGLFCHTRQSRDCGRSFTSPLKSVLPPLACPGNRGIGSAADHAGNGAECRLEVGSSSTVTACTQSGLRSRPLSALESEI